MQMHAYTTGRPSFWVMSALCLLADRASGQSASVLGRDDAQFARGLHEHGYSDLAEALCRSIVANGATGTTLLEVEALGFDLEVERIRQGGDIAERAAALRGVIERENAFLSGNARSRVAEVVRDNLPGVYLEYAGALVATLAREQDPARRAELVQQGEQVFGEAEESMKQRIQRFTQQVEDGTGNLAYAERQLVAARFGLPRMEYQHSLLFAEGSPDRVARLESALDGFQDFGFDYADTLQNYQGIIYQGLCHEALGADEEALVDYEDAAALRDQFVSEGGVYQVGPEEADVVSGATLRRVQLLSRMNRHLEAVNVATDFIATIPDALASSSGLQVLAAKAEAEIGAGDVSAAGATAQALVDADPSGLGARTGREILGRLPVTGLPPDKILRIAETAAQRGEFSRALDLLRRAREAVAGARDEQEIGAASYFLAGRVFSYEGRLHEASLAFDCASDLYPSGSKAPEALNAAVSAYRELARKERSRFYANRADERMNALARRYPQHPLAANAGIWQGMRREDEGDLAGAIDFYSKVDPSSPSYQEAALRLAGAMHQRAKLELQTGNDASARPQLARAEEQYRRALEKIAEARAATLDVALQQRLAGFASGARMGLASLLLELGRAPEVLPLLQDMEAEQGLGPDSIAMLWSLRIRALEAQGELEQASAMLDAIVQRTPDAPGIATAAAVLARALDRAADGASADPARVAGAEELWRKAAFYYRLSVEGALAGSSPLRSDEVLEVAQRLYVIGLLFNDVPEGQQGFVEWQGTVVDAGPWEEAARIYERLDAQAPSYRVSIERARTLALLGRMVEAEAIYARLFDQNALIPPGSTGGAFDRTVVEARPELVAAYLEWGVATHLTAIEPRDVEKLDRAASIFARMLENTTPDGRTWWQAKYSQIRLLSDRGDYELADTAIRSVKRTTDPRYDKGRFGFEEKFAALESELAKKVFKKN